MNMPTSVPFCLKPVTRKDPAGPTRVQSAMSSSSDAAPRRTLQCYLCESNEGYIYYEIPNTEHNREWQKQNMPSAYCGKIFKKAADNDMLPVVICQKCSDNEDAKLAEYQAMLDDDDNAKAEHDELTRAMAESLAMANEKEKLDKDDAMLDAEHDELTLAIVESLAMAEEKEKLDKEDVRDIWDTHMQCPACMQFVELSIPRERCPECGSNLLDNSGDA